MARISALMQSGRVNEMTDREAFDVWALSPAPDEWWGLSERERLFLAWQAATTHERERCAAKCENIEKDKWALYKGRPPYTGVEPGRFSDVAQGQADGAGQCADAIRKVE